MIFNLLNDAANFLSRRLMNHTKRYKLDVLINEHVTSSDILD
jgi:hypothetical protein